MKIRKIVSTILAVVICMSASSGMFVEQAVYAAEEVLIEDVQFYASKDGTGEILPDLAGASSASVCVQVSNQTTEKKELGVFLACYDAESTLLKVEDGVKEFQAGQTDTVTVGIEFTSATVGQYVRAFVWDMTDNAQKPLMNDTTLKATQNIYVSPAGNDEAAGTFSAPVQTLSAAQSLARERNNNMTEDLFVNLRSGTYNLSSTLSFGTEDSGTNGNAVHYRSYGDETAVLSGGKKVDGWSTYDAEKRIFYAKATGLESVRELFVNGKKAQLAKSNNRIYPLGFYKETINGIETIRGHIVSDEDIDLYQNADNIQLRYTRVWKNTLCNVSEIVAGEPGTYVIKMDPKAFSLAVDSDAYLPLTEDISFYVENAYELLDEANEFYYDGTYIYYKAEADETVENAYVPVLDTLMEVKGEDLYHKAKNLSFEGLTFAHATRSDLDEGYLGDQAQLKTPIDELESSYPLDNTIVGGNIRVYTAENIHFTGNTFTGLSAVGLGLYDGTDRINIVGNRFYNLGDSAVTVGQPSDAYMDEEYSAGWNVALHKPVTSCGQVKTDATYANDGDRTTIWSTPNNLASDYWQVDLGKPYTINEIRIKSRLGTTEESTEIYRGQTAHRQEFAVLGSNAPAFSDKGSLLTTLGRAPFDYDAGFVGVVANKTKFRYIRFRPTKDKYFPLAEIEVISSDDGMPIKEVCKNSLIANNYITEIGEVNWGAPGIQLYYTEGIEVSHNLLRNMPYSGICVGWGWTNTTDSVTAKNNVVSHNEIDGFAQKMYDAGGVYLLGTQQNTRVTGNYIKNQSNLYYAFYADSGSENFTVTDNVFEDIDMVFALGREGNPTSKMGMTVTNNYATNACYTFSLSVGNNSVVQAPLFYLKGKEPAAASAIIESAGLEAPYTYLTEGVPVTNALSVEEMYGNIIDRHLEATTDTIGSLSDVNLIHYYLNNKIEEAESILAAGTPYASAAAKGDFETAIATAKSKWQTYLNQTKNDSGVIVHTTKNVNRKSVLETRETLIAAIETFVSSLSE
ncbi:MAG: hypothetical protein E7400_01620 [Ruminococcaceae bacterium]|nr:hypothetical protein [Oscillospiraceae bacterium]